MAQEGTGDLSFEEPLGRKASDAASGPRKGVVSVVGGCGCQTEWDRILGVFGEFTTHLRSNFSGWIGMFTGGTIWPLTHGHVGPFVIGGLPSQSPKGSLFFSFSSVGFPYRSQRKAYLQKSHTRTHMSKACLSLLLAQVFRGRAEFAGSAHVLLDQPVTDVAVVPKG